MQNAKCKRKLQMQNANLKFWSKPKILPKPKIFAKQEFYSPLACKHLCWPQLGRSAKKFIGLTLKCQLKRYLGCHHVLLLLLCYLKFQTIMPLGTPNFHQMSLVTPGCKCQHTNLPTCQHANMPTCRLAKLLVCNMPTCQHAKMPAC